MSSRHALRLFAAVALAASTLPACSAGGATDSPVTLSLVAYSTPQLAYTEIIRAYQATPEGRNIRFHQSYGASGDQSRAVAAGLKADVVAFSLEPDITRLVKEGLVADDWANSEHKGMVTESVVVLATRKGNPEKISDWDDLTKGGVEVITPNPFTSGSARWNVLAGYGAKSAKGTRKADGIAYLQKLFDRVAVQDDTARKALQTFTGGKGDVLLAYENEAIFAKRKGQKIDYVVPDSTILIENPIAVTKRSAHPAQAAAFLRFLRGPKAQAIFAKHGYRPVLDIPGADFPQPSELFTIADLGGWASVSAEFFDPKQSVMAEIERKLGVATERG